VVSFPPPVLIRVSFARLTNFVEKLILDLLEGGVVIEIVTTPSVIGKWVLKSLT